MKIQSLAIMFIILILPISMVLASYTQSRVETLSLQSKYDSKLKDATYDALKAYQLNSLNNDTSDYANSKIRDIKASVNTFFNSIATNFSTIGYSKEVLQNYIPAIVYTMYDGYYIYSPYTNTWGTNSSNETIKNEMKEQIKPDDQSTYKDGENLYGLKPYVYYSCRYKATGIDVVITYSLDNYISIQGTINAKPISKYGYILSDVEEGNTVTYKGIRIDTENKNYKENIMLNGDEKAQEYYCIKKNGTKYYLDNNGEVFSVLNGKKIVQNGMSASEFSQNNSAKNYYIEARELKNFITDNRLDQLTIDNIVDENGNYFSKDKNPYQELNKNGSKYIFDFTNIENEDSNFNTHRRDVIKYSIERNLSIAISNYNNYSGSSNNFQMPKLKETDWDTIMNNISIISFLQGINIGGKVYNGYSVINNNKNLDVVTEDSIYIKNGDAISRVTEDNLTVNPSTIGIFNINLERKSGENSSGQTNYYFPVVGTLSYDSIVTQNNVKSLKDALTGDLAKIYYTALGRERYGMYRPKLEITN